MIEMTARTLMESIYDGDMNEITLIFEDRDTKAIATGRDPEGSKDDEFYFYKDITIPVIGIAICMAWLLLYYAINK